METLTRLVSESMARHGFDRPLDYRRLQWSRWFRCESHHSLLCVPSKPGVFALAEEVMAMSPDLETERVATGASPVPRTLNEVKESGLFGAKEQPVVTVEERPFRAASEATANGALDPVPQAGTQKPDADSARRMLAVTQFFEDDDMAFVLDRMLSRNNPMRPRLESGRYFVRFVEIHDQAQRRSICSALNQWIVSSAEKATGIGSHFATSLELTSEPSVGRAPTRANADSGTVVASTEPALNQSAQNTAPLEAVTATTVQRSPLFPSGF
ncbi:MAG TPA: hypothetical protein VGS27_33055 [Candidatus Sulfotelmatobacter sp.]|nr:hypothetical protein [Candidatus Sulfotelmatobacter sp.]